MAAGNFPPLPSIAGDSFIQLDVFARMPMSAGGNNDEYGDAERLAELGGKVLELAATHHLFRKKPPLPVDQIKADMNTSISEDVLNKWFAVYELENKVRYDLAKYGGTREFFNTFVGALFIRNGLPTVQTWISGLLDPGSHVDQPTEPQSYSEPPSYPGTSAATGQSNQAQTQQQPWPMPEPQPPLSPPPPLPAARSPPPSGALVTLAIVNQIAAQNHMTIAYPAEQISGPPHQPTWRVRCQINGVDKGMGEGKNQKSAKEEAARQAWAAMGWGSF